MILTVVRTFFIPFAGGGQFQTRDRFLVSQGENSWRNRRCFAEEQPSKPTSQMEEVKINPLYVLSQLI